MRGWILGLGWLAGVALAGDYPYQPVPFTAVHVRDGFWTPRLETNRQTTVWYDFQKCEETGRIDNFAKAGKLMPGEFRGTPFDDSDVFKVIEGAAYSLALQPDPKLDKYLDDLIAKIAAAQEPDGYLYSARTIDPKKREGFHGPTRWSRLAGSHELYNLGHLYEGAVAHYLATGKKTLLDVATKSADLLCNTFGPGKIQEPPGHEEIEIGLCKLYRATGRQKYLDLAKYYVDIRGRESTHKLRGAYQQDHVPVVEQDEAVGHAVRAGYLYSGVADVAALTGDEKLIAAIDRIWNNVAEKKQYLTGGIGARHAGEAFGENFELPNASAYNETCAAIANALWNQRMFLLHGEAKYAHVLEHILYNGFLSGVALTGDAFFYPNPLESRAGYKRSPWFGCSCCPVNVVRMVPSVPGYVYATRGDALFVNLFIGGTAKVQLGGQAVTLVQTGNYPWDGQIKIAVAPEKPATFALKLRIPGWARNEPLPGGLYRYADAVPENWSVKVNGAPQSFQALENGYAVISKAWKNGDVVELELPMSVRRVLARDEVKADRSRFAVMRGPIVYCAEGADNGGKVLNWIFPGKISFAEELRPDLFGGVMTLKMTSDAQDNAALTLIPYCLWENRGPSEMAVWFRSEMILEPWAASFCHDADSVEACFDGQLPKNSGDHKIPRMTWWDHKGTAEWVERTFEKPTTLFSSEVYWFDDTGRGACRVPQSWKLLYKDGNDWKAVKTTASYGVAKDQFNAITFKPVTTTALRLEVQLQPQVSGGILEWRMK